MDETTTISLGSSSFGCCHRYRECSDEKRCLLQDEDNERAALCSYRVTLEQGNIFYGKNSKNFLMKQYTELRQTYHNTSGNVRCALDDVILYFAGNSYLTSHVLWFYSPELDTLQRLGLISYQRHDKLVLEKYTMKELKDATGSKLQKKDELINHIVHDLPDTLALLTAPYCFVQIPQPMRIYLIELYYDFFYTTPHNRYGKTLPFAKKEKQDGGSI